MNIQKNMIILENIKKKDIICGKCISLHQIADALGKAVDAKDPNTYKHSQQVAIISYILALQCGFNEEYAELIHIAGHLHDLGKIGIPDEILLKNDIFNEYEKEIMRSHSRIGYEILTKVDVFKETGIDLMVLYHHEFYDGSGYPCGLKGNDIPVGSRIISIADALSAMIQNRNYRPKISYKEATQELIRCSGKQFDPDIVKEFINCSNIIELWITNNE